jgi:hypothetical protein
VFVCHISESTEEGRDYPAKFSGVLQSDSPNDKMDQASWKGNFLGIPGEKPELSLTMTQLLLRVCHTLLLLLLFYFTLP